MEFNVQDLFLDLQYPVEPGLLTKLTEREWQLLGKTDAELKPLAKLRGLARVFLEERPDIAMLCEVGGYASLANFSRLFLEDTYEPLLVPGNDERGIHNGFLVHRDLPLRSSIISHRDWPVPFEYLHESDPVGHELTAFWAHTLALGAPAERKFSRDLPELRLLKPDGSLALVILLAHLKSRLDRDRIDPAGNTRRAAEFQALLAIYGQISAAVGSAVPVIVAGDFNAVAAREGTSPELRDLYLRTDLEDALELAGCPSYERMTQVSYVFGQGHAEQIDYILLPRVLHATIDRKSTRVYRYKFEEDASEIQMPGSMRDRSLLPSDHYPLITVIQLNI